MSINSYVWFVCGFICIPRFSLRMENFLTPKFTILSISFWKVFVIFKFEFSFFFYFDTPNWWAFFLKFLLQITIYPQFCPRTFLKLLEILVGKEKNYKTLLLWPQFSSVNIQDFFFFWVTGACSVIIIFVWKMFSLI